MFLNCSTCFERQAAHHQELKNCNCSLWFYIHLWLPAAVSCQQPQRYVKPETAITVFELLMMSGVSLETCWAIKKHWNNKFYYTVQSCWLFLYDFYTLLTFDGILVHSAKQQWSRCDGIDFSVGLRFSSGSEFRTYGCLHTSPWNVSTAAMCSLFTLAISRSTYEASICLACSDTFASRTRHAVGSSSVYTSVLISHITGILLFTLKRWLN